MKKVLLFAMLLLPQMLVAQENDYLSLLEVGKKWHYTYRNWATGKTYQFMEYLAGDTIIDEKNYIKNCQQDGQVLNLLREDGGKVYEYNSREKNERLLYDFTLCIGDTVESWSECEGMVVTDINEVSTGGVSRKRMTLCQYTAEFIADDRPDFWIEGMGSHGGLMNTFPNRLTGNFVRLDYIEMPDGSKFSFYDIDNISPYELREISSGAIYDLSGRRVANSSEFQGSSFKLPKGVYIQGGKKFVVK